MLASSLVNDHMSAQLCLALKALFKFHRQSLPMGFISQDYGNLLPSLAGHGILCSRRSSSKSLMVLKFQQSIRLLHIRHNDSSWRVECFHKSLPQREGPLSLRSLWCDVTVRVCYISVEASKIAFLILSDDRYSPQYDAVNNIYGYIVSVVITVHSKILRQWDGKCHHDCTALPVLHASKRSPMR